MCVGSFFFGINTICAWFIFLNIWPEFKTDSTVVVILCSGLGDLNGCIWNRAFLTSLEYTVEEERHSYLG